MNNQRYKICLVSISLAGGGAERSCAMLSEMLHQLGHKVHIAILNDDIDYPFAGELFNLGIYKKNNDSLWQRFGRLKRFRRFLVDNSFDVIIDHRTKNNYLKELFYDRYIYKDLKRIYVVHSSNRSLYLTERPERFVKIYNRNCQNVAVSNYIQKEILEKEGVKNCITIYNTYDDKWENEITDLPSTLQNKTYILSYGRIVDSVKDFSFLIRSFNRSKVWEQDNYLVIMGDGDDKEILKDITSKLPCSNHIQFLPFTATPFSHIAKAHFVTLTSRYEGFPMVLVESLSLGTPVVSLDIVSGPSEIIEHKENGLLVEKRDVSLFSDAIKTMCFNNSLYTRCKENAEPSVKKYSREVISNKWNKLLMNELQ